MSVTQRFAARAQRMKASEIRELLKLLDQPGILSFAGGIPDPALFPSEAFQAATGRCLGAEAAGVNLQYSASEGNGALRAWLVEHMRALGVECELDNILITSGSQQALDCLGKLFLNAGDTAFVGWPTYLGALGAFNAYEPRYERLEAGDNRPAQALLAEAEAAGGVAKLMYATPDFANPTGETMTREARVALLARAEALGAVVVEDAAYRMLRYAGEDVPLVLALELERRGDIDQCRTVFCGSFSKTLAPGLRVGWVCAAREVIEKLVLLKQASDLHSPTLNQAIVADVANSIFEPHVARLRAAYGARLEAMLAALEAYMPEGVGWSRPEGGMFVWLTLPEEADAAQLLERALEEEKIAFVPGAAFFADGSGRNTLRLNFSMLDAAQIEEGMLRLGRCLGAVL